MVYGCNHTNIHIHVQCSLASAELAQAHPNYSFVLKVVWYPVYLRLANLEIHADTLFTFLIC